MLGNHSQKRVAMTAVIHPKSERIGVRANAAPRVNKGIPQHPVPVMVLARLAVDLQHQGAGLGKALLKDALLRTTQAADIAGIRALLVHAKDESARQWYLNWEFEPSPSDPFHLWRVR